jgi:hypothetical protein
VAGQSDMGALLSRDEEDLGEEATLWLVYKWERLMPLSAYAGAEQPATVLFPFWIGNGDVEGRRRDRARMLRWRLPSALSWFPAAHAGQCHHC